MLVCSVVKVRGSAVKPRKDIDALIQQWRFEAFPSIALGHAVDFLAAHESD